MLVRSAQRGFTIIELMVTITIFAILLMLGVPSFSNLLQNHKLSSAAQGYLAGLQSARSEAIRLNKRVEFVLSSVQLTGDVSADAPAASPNVNGPHWIIRYLSDDPTPVYKGVESKSAQDGSGRTGATSVVVLGSVAGDAPATTVYSGTIAFDGFGRPVDNSAAPAGNGAFELNVSNPPAGTCAADGGTMRCMRIRVRPGGQLQLCDPAAATDGSDNRGCQATP